MFEVNNQIGLDISGHKLRMVSVSQQYRKLAMHHFAELDLPAGCINNGTIAQPDILIKHLRELPKHGFGVHWQEPAVHVGLPEQQTFITTVASNASTLEEAEKEVKRFLPFREEEMYYDIKIHRSSRTIAVAASRRDHIQQYLAILAAANYHVIGLHCETEAIALALVNEVADKKTGAIIIDLGTARTTVIFFLHNAVYFTTSYPSVLAGGGIEQDHLAAVVQQVKQYYEEHYAMLSPLGKFLLCGSGAAIPNLVEWLQYLTKIPTAVGNPIKHFKMNHVLKRLQYPLAFTTAIGLALPK